MRQERPEGWRWAHGEGADTGRGRKGPEVEQKGALGPADISRGSQGTFSSGSAEGRRGQTDV